MKISTKLEILSAAAIIALAIALGCGFYIAGKMQDSVDYSNKRSIPVLKAIYEVKTGLQAIAIDVYKHILSVSPQEKTEIAADIRSHEQVVKSNFQAIEKLVRSEKGRAIFNAYKSAADDYFNNLPEVLEKSQKDLPSRHSPRHRDWRKSEARWRTS